MPKHGTRGRFLVSEQSQQEELNSSEQDSSPNKGRSSTSKPDFKGRNSTAVQAKQTGKTWTHSPTENDQKRHVHNNVQLEKSAAVLGRPSRPLGLKGRGEMSSGDGPPSVGLSGYDGGHRDFRGMSSRDGPPSGSLAGHKGNLSPKLGRYSHGSHHGRGPMMSRYTDVTDLRGKSSGDGPSSGDMPRYTGSPSTGGPRGSTVRYSAEGSSSGALLGRKESSDPKGVRYSSGSLFRQASVAHDRVRASGTFNPALLRLMSEQKSSDSDCFFDDLVVKKTSGIKPRKGEIMTEAKLAGEKKWRTSIAELHSDGEILAEKQPEMQNKGNGPASLKRCDLIDQDSMHKRSSHRKKRDGMGTRCKGRRDSGNGGEENQNTQLTRKLPSGRGSHGNTHSISFDREGGTFSSDGSRDH